MPSPLVCPDCGATYDPGPGEPWRCDCGHPLEFAERPLPDGPAPDFSELDTREGLWAFEEFLPVRRVVSLGEGFTPLADAPDWDAQFKLDCVFPSGSFKDRGATVTLSRAAELGVERVLEDSSGNAGAAIAQYAARAGIDADIYVPADVKESKLAAIERSGATTVRVEGSRQDVTDACVRSVEGAGRRPAEDEGAGRRPAEDEGAGRRPAEDEGAGRRPAEDEGAGRRPAEDEGAGRRPAEDEGAGRRPADSESGRNPRQSGEGWYASHAWNPAFFAGTMTFALEVAAQRDWSVPDAVVTPLGHGTLFLGAYRGFRALVDAGWTDEMPRLLGVQANGVAPIAAELHGDADGERNDVADGIQITRPARRDQILDAVEATDGDAIALDADVTDDALDALRRSGFYVEPTSAVAVAGLSAYRERGVLGDDEDVVVALTGSGLKS
ncbi:pyridoxal-phosphate dependent enzyme [Halomicrococcus sp. SG-WS-1]|uniref:pyridoxal-phosphate dependent enzyme n=1 Tax=Halomicrococcus sp. SG-WS-1 TaxID=3439057 RepID=UPI003F797296